MKKLRMLVRILRVTNTLQLLYGFLGYFFTAAFALTLLEPQIKSYGDGLWFCFASVTTIGYGDLCAVTGVGRIITVFLAVYGIVLTALLTGSIVNFIGEQQKMRADESVAAFLEKLERLEELSKDELAALSAEIRSKRNW